MSHPRRTTSLSLFLLIALLLLPACKPPATGETGDKETANLPTVEEGEQPKVAFVTNMVANFWRIAEVGANDAGNEFDAEVIVKMPPTEGRVLRQQEMVEELISMGVHGIAISPCDAENQTDLLNRAAKECWLITQDSDAPDSDRLCYVGMSNYDAGVMCGQLVKEALPEGGTVVIFVGTLSQENARLRRQGLIDEVLGREHDETRYDEPDAVLEGEKYTILATRTDSGNFLDAKAVVENELSIHPDVDCMVGLFEYNPPAILEAVKAAERIDDIAVIGFDENDATLQAIIDGECHGTIVQNPYEYGYKSIEILAALARGDESVLPEDGFVDIEARQITADNVEEFWAEKKRLVGEEEPAEAEE